MSMHLIKKLRDIMASEFNMEAKKDYKGSMEWDDSSQKTILNLSLMGKNYKKLREVQTVLNREFKSYQVRITVR